MFSALAAAPMEALPQPTPSVVSAPPEDPLYKDDIGVWTYIPEFSDWFTRQKLKEPGPTGAYAVNFQVWQVEELDRCVFNVFLDNHLPIDYPEDPVGFLPFAYPASWAFLKLSTADQQVIDTTYLNKYREPRTVLSHRGGEETLTLFQFRKAHKQRMAVLTLTMPCERAAQLQPPLTLHVRTATGKMHDIGLPEHFASWIQANLRKWHRPPAKTREEGLADQNEWSYSAAFAKRFGLPPLNEPPPTGAEAVAFRVERYPGDRSNCFLDLYLDDTVPVLFPEGESGFSSSYLGYFLSTRGRKEVEQSTSVRPSYTMRSGSFDSELFAVMELRTERERRTFPIKRHLNGDQFRVTLNGPLDIDQYRKHVVPGLSYLSLGVVCGLPVPDKGPGGVAVVRIGGSTHDILFPVPFLKRVQRQVRERVELPFERQYPKMFPKSQGN